MRVCGSSAVAGRSPTTSASDHPTAMNSILIPLQNSKFRLSRSLIHAADVVFPHPGLQGGALEAEPRSGAGGAADVPVGFLQRIQNACTLHHLRDIRRPNV